MDYIHIAATSNLALKRDETQQRSPFCDGTCEIHFISCLELMGVWIDTHRTSNGLTRICLAEKFHIPNEIQQFKCEKSRKTTVKSFVNTFKQTETTSDLLTLIYTRWSLCMETHAQTQAKYSLKV